MRDIHRKVQSVQFAQDAWTVGREELMARERSGRTAQHLVLAARLRGLREGAGLSLREAAEALRAHPATVRRIELAQTSLDPGQVSTLLEAYGAAPGEREAIMDRLAAANLPGWWHPWRDALDPWQQDLMSVESAASLLRVWDPALVPLLLRTPAYARAVDAVLRPELSQKTRERRAELLAERQKHLVAQQAKVWALLPASALRVQVGDPDTMREQVEALRAAAARPDVTIQLHAEDGSVHPLSDKPALTFYRVAVDEIRDHVVREGGLAGMADVWDSKETVTAYRMLLDVSCLSALRPDRTIEVLHDY